MTGEWQKWEGGKPPEIPGLRCDIKFRNGNVFEDVNAYDWWPEFEWDCDPDQQIVAYRLLD